MTQNDLPREVPVIVVGAGPAGLMTAVSLARYGVQTLLVERREELASLPRATVVSTRSMELLRGWGLAEQTLAGGVDVEWVGWTCRTLTSASAGAPWPVGLPTREQSALVSPVAPACVPQDHLEPVLLSHARSLAAAEVALGTELVSVENGPGGVVAVLRRLRTGQTARVHARYLVGADGAHSRVRAALGISMRGPDNLRTAVTALFRAPLWRLLDGYRYGIYAIEHPEATGSVLPAGPGDRWLYGVQWEPGQQRLADFTASRMTDLVRVAAGVPDLPVRVERVGGFTFAAQLAERFRSDSAFLVGDAAHRVTPRGGTGMNTAIHDGYDLGWKLAWVLRGWADPALLDSYEAERRPVAVHNVARSADENGSTRGAEQELPVDLGGRIPHRWLPSATGPVSTLDLLTPGLTLFTGPDHAGWAAAAAAHSQPVPLSLRSLDPMTARTLGIASRGALLVRPDGSPAGWWAHGAGAVPALAAAVQAATTGAPSPRTTPAGVLAARSGDREIA